MPLPIAVGGVSLSSERLRGPFQPQPSLSSSSLRTPNDEENSKPFVSELRPHQSVTWAVCPRNEWQARTVVSFFDKDGETSGGKDASQLQEEKKQKRKRMVEIRVQISPVVRALSPKVYRERSYHLELFTYKDDDDKDYGERNDFRRDNDNHLEALDDTNDDEDSFSSDSETDDDEHIGNSLLQEETHRQPQVVFSQDRRHLMVLLFHKKRGDSNLRKQNGWMQIAQQQSAIILFQLQKPKIHTTSSSEIRSRLPLPTYIAKATPGDSGKSNTSEQSTSHPNNPLVNISSNIGGSPAVVINPRFVPSCNGITAICRLCGEPCRHDVPQSSLRRPNFFLAIKNDGTLNWVNAHSARITATAEVPGFLSNCYLVSSMKTSPGSTLESGVVALVIASSNPSSSSQSESSLNSQSIVSHMIDYDVEGDNDDASSIESATSTNTVNSDEVSTHQRIKGGDCVLIKWSKTSEQTPSANNGNTRSMINVGLQAVWAPPSGVNENDELRVSGVCFGSIRSVMCVVYTDSNKEQVSFGPRQKMAQIVTISDTVSNGISEGCILVPTVSLYLSPDQVEQAPNVANVERTNDSSNDGHNYGSYDTDSCDDYETSANETSSDDESEERRKDYDSGMMIESQLVGIQHDPGSDSFVVSSIFRGNHELQDHWVGCVWNWRANAVGWMIQHELPTRQSSFRNSIPRSSDGICWSRLYIGRDPCNEGGLYLAYMNSLFQYDNINDNGFPQDFGNTSILKTSKRFVPVAFLSPANSRDPVVFTGRSSLLLAENHLSFPYVARKDSEVNVREVDWKISALPLSYIMSQGSPQIAALGSNRAKSIAVASARGVCIMDTHHKKWKQFGSPSEERSFSVLGMTWWEGSQRGEKDDKSDDLLVAITQTISGERYLSCWTSKRLDLMHQLMDTPDLEWKPGESQDPEPSWGIPLPEHIRVTSISLLSEPEPEEHISGDDSKPRRAVALVYSPDVATEKCNYVLFQLQVFRNKIPASHSSETYVARRPFYVMAHETRKGSMNCSDHSGPITSAFIASACFHFDLCQSKKKKPIDIDDGEFVATLGVARTPGGFQALSVFKNGEASAAPLTHYEVSKYQLSDRIFSDAPASAKSSPIIKCVWNIELLNGSVLCWSTPSIVGPFSQALELQKKHSSRFKVMNTNFQGIKRPRGIDRPCLVCEENCLGKNRNWLLGSLCEVGGVSEWAIQSTLGCQFDISLGSVPHMVFGCVLRCGQNSQKFARDQVEGINCQIFSSNVLRSKSFSQSPFTITPPAFVISLFTLLLEAAFIKTGINAAESSSDVGYLKNHLHSIEMKVCNRLKSVQNTDSLMMTLRLVTSRSLEIIAKTYKMHSKEQSESTEFNLRLSQILLQTVIDATRSCTSDLQFASLFLEVGRQTEPSNLQHLFPLPLPANETELKLSPCVLEAKSVVDLFTICIDKGSLAAAASALPLLTSKAQARYYCELLLDESIDNFVRNSSPNQSKFDSTEEARRVLGDIFRFGMKLEDAEFYEEKMIAENQDGRISIDVTSVNTQDRSLSSQIFAPDSPQKRNLICSLTAPNSILNYLVPSSMQAESEKQRMEDAIRREASSFIKRSLDDPVLDFVTLPDWDDSFGSPNGNNIDTDSVAYLVGEELLELLQAETSSNNWKVIAAFAKLLLQDGVETTASHNLFVEVVDNAQPLDILSIIPESYDGENGLEQNLTNYIEEEICSCFRQITSADANHIIRMSLLLIDRLQLLPLSDISDRRVLELSLAFVIVVASDVSGRSQYVQDILQEDSVLSKCYKRYVQSSEHTRRKAEI